MCLRKHIGGNSDQFHFRQFEFELLVGYPSGDVQEKVGQMVPMLRTMIWAKDTNLGGTAFRQFVNWKERKGWRRYVSLSQPSKRQEDPNENPTVLWESIISLDFEERC